MRSLAKAEKSLVTLVVAEELLCKVIEQEISDFIFNYLYYIALTSNLGESDKNAQVVWSGAYEAFGSLVRSNGTLDFTPSYTGKQFDQDTGLYYYNARFYEPMLGRFIQPDPIRSGSAWEIYSSDNPTSRYDPTGLEDVSAQDQRATFGAWQKTWAQLGRDSKTLYKSLEDKARKDFGAGYGRMKSLFEGGKTDIFGAAFEKAYSQYQLATLVDLGTNGTLTFAEESGTNGVRLNFDQLTAKAVENGHAINDIGTVTEGLLFAYEGARSGGMQPASAAAATGASRIEAEIAAANRMVAESGKKANLGASSVNASEALRAKLSALEDAQTNAASVRTLEDGRIRYYTPEVPATKPGPSRGASYVTEFDPLRGNIRSWMETYDQSGAVNRVHPKMQNGQTLNSWHFPPTAKELGLQQ